MDLDIHAMSVGTLRYNVTRLLEAPAFVQALRAQGIEIAKTSSPKQTETTQRWKLTLRVIESGAKMPTKIKFSLRGLDGDNAFAGQVLAFLEPEYQGHYGNRKAWTDLQKQVVDGLGALGQ